MTAPGAGALAVARLETGDSGGERPVARLEARLETGDSGGERPVARLEMAYPEAEEAISSLESAGAGDQEGAASLEMGDSGGELPVSSVETGESRTRSSIRTRDAG
ncbi:hypothetical protein [Sorangium sp. So ce1153]|uniref:hypothetical protein n=1 Tax=Sorangium sp. So ce1153 TaxID=3133333 RepID=UPI003F626CBC